MLYQDTYYTENYANVLLMGECSIRELFKRSSKGDQYRTLNYI